MKWLGFIVLLATLLIPIPVMAIGVSPYSENITVYANSYTELEFTVTDCNEVDLSLENIPLAVEPSHTLVISGKVTASILGSLSVPSGVYEGYLVFLESGQQVGAGVKVSLTVNHINNSQSVLLTTTVLQPSSTYYSWPGGGSNHYVPPTSETITSTGPPLPVYTPPPVITVPPIVNIPPISDYTTLPTEPPAPSSNTQWYLLGAILLSIVGLILLIVYLRRRNETN